MAHLNGETWQDYIREEIKAARDIHNHSDELIWQAYWDGVIEAYEDALDMHGKMFSRCLKLSSYYFS